MNLLSIKKMVFLLVFCITFTSCEKFLVQEPKEEVSENILFSTVPNAYAAVLGAYSFMSGDMGFGNRLSFVYPYDDDNVIHYLLGSSQADFKISKFDYTADNIYLSSPFKQLYRGIEHANICIKRIPLMDQYNSGSEVEKSELKRLHGEALTLRAIYYQELIKNWGDVPAPFDPAIDQVNLDLPKTNRDIIYDRLIADLKIAENLVPWRKDAGVPNDERITKGAVKALRARLALFRGGYALRADTRTIERRADYLDFYKIAKQECVEIMLRRDKHNLNPSFESVFKESIMINKIEPNGEVILEVALGGGISSTFDGKISSFNGPKIYGKGSGRITVSPVYFYAFKPLDKRRDVTIAPYTISTSNYYQGITLPNINDGKFRKDWAPIPLDDIRSAYGVNFPLIRFSDVLLMFAEADNEINKAPSADAIKAFEEVRKRGFGSDASSIGITPTTYTDFFNAIVDERALEFGGEGVRKYDLKRWNLLYPKIQEARNMMLKMVAKSAPYDNGYAQNMYYKTNSPTLIFSNSFYANSPSATPSGYTKIAWLSGITASYLNRIDYAFVQNKSELYPLPQSIIDDSKVLKQDYGY